MRDQQGGEVAEPDAGDNADEGLLEQIEHRVCQREFAASHRHRQHGEGDDRAHGVVERGLAHHGLRHPVANPDLPEDRNQRRRIGRGERRAEQQRHGEGDAEDVMRGRCRVMKVVISTPMVARTTMVIQTCFKT